MLQDEIKNKLDQKDAGALADIGYYFEQGIGLSQSYEKARTFYELAVALDDPTAQNNLAWLYMNGYGVEKDLSTALYYFQKSGENGNSIAYTNLGYLMEQGEHYELAAKYYRAAASMGNDDALFNLGTAYHYGNGVPQDYEKAYEIFDYLLDRKDYGPANFYIGYYFENGIMLPPSFKEAEHYYRAGAKYGDPACMTNLAVLLSKGEAGEPDYTEALHWYKKAAKLGDSLANVNIGWFYENGLGVEQDYKKAISWYRKGVKLGEPHAMTNLGGMYEDGLGVFTVKSKGTERKKRIPQICKKDSPLLQRSH